MSITHEMRYLPGADLIDVDACVCVCGKSPDQMIGLLHIGYYAHDAMQQTKRQIAVETIGGRIGTFGT